MKLFLGFGFFYYTYYIGITVIARWPASGISSELLSTIKTQKSLDYFIIPFLSN
jgi:hypothetical protein